MKEDIQRKKDFNIFFSGDSSLFIYYYFLACLDSDAG